MDVLKQGLESVKKEVNSIGLEKPPWLQSLQSGEAFKAPEMPAFKAPEMPAFKAPVLPKFSMPSVTLPEAAAKDEVAAAAPAATPKPAAAPVAEPSEVGSSPGFKAPEMPSFSMPSFSLPEMPAAAPPAPKPTPKPTPKPKPKPAPSPPPPAPNPFTAFFDGLFKKGSSPVSGARPKPQGPVIAQPADTFDDDLSAWPAILSIKDSLEEMPPEEQRRQRLEVGTNWPPRTTTAMAGEREGPLAFFDFDDEGRNGYMFFQGPTPKTGVQPDLAPLLSKEDLALSEVNPKLFVFGGLAAPSLAYVLYFLITQ